MECSAGLSETRGMRTAPLYHIYPAKLLGAKLVFGGYGAPALLEPRTDTLRMDFTVSALVGRVAPADPQDIGRIAAKSRPARECTGLIRYCGLHPGIYHYVILVIPLTLYYIIFRITGIGNL